MKKEFIYFSEELDKIRNLDILSFKKLYNKKLNIFITTGSEKDKDEMLQMQKSFNKFFISKK